MQEPLIGPLLSFGPAEDPRVGDQAADYSIRGLGERGNAIVSRPRLDFSARVVAFSFRVDERGESTGRQEPYGAVLGSSEQQVLNHSATDAARGTPNKFLGSPGPETGGELTEFLDPIKDGALGVEPPSEDQRGLCGNERGDRSGSALLDSWTFPLDLFADLPVLLKRFQDSSRHIAAWLFDRFKVCS